ncbi:MAG: hypothetical protein HY725_22330 [Candidatus Rokubacteria bacterium]|nr:hypothetical protein [Candidatus Rokubacteria bacterium]
MGPAWFRLLDQYRREGYFGLTPSFLVGALRNPPGAVLDEQTSLAEFRALLQAMMDETPSGFLVRIAQCPRLRQPVAAALPGTPTLANASLGEAISSRGGAASQLYVWPEYFSDESRGLESVTAALWKVFGRPTCEGRFSYRDAAFQPLDADDLRFIRRAFEAQDEV